MRQILFIHGGDSFSSHQEYIDALKTKQLNYDQLRYSRRWREWVAEQLAEDDILTPNFPNGFNAQYDEWVIFFEKILPFLKPGAILVGHSLGAMFLAKYLHSHILAAKMRRIILVAGRYGDTQENGSFDVSSASGVERSTDEVHLFHSVDDPVVPFDDVMLFQNDIPNSIVHRFSTRGHFIDATFPEMLDLLKQK